MASLYLKELKHCAISDLMGSTVVFRVLVTLQVLSRGEERKLAYKSCNQIPRSVALLDVLVLHSMFLICSVSAKCFFVNYTDQS